jgi:hypothetical protein
LVSAGRDSGSHSFEIQHLGEHIRFYLRLFRVLNTAGFSLTNPLVELSDLTITETLLDAAGVSRDQAREMVRAHRPGSSTRFLAERGVTLPTDIVDPAVELENLVERHPLRRQISRLITLKRKLFDQLQTQHPEAQFRFARLESFAYYTGLCLRISSTAPDGVRYGIVDGGLTDWTARLLQNNKERLLTSGIGSEFACKRYRGASPFDQSNFAGRLKARSYWTRYRSW